MAVLMGEERIGAIKKRFFAPDSPSFSLSHTSVTESDKAEWLVSIVGHYKRLHSQYRAVLLCLIRHLKPYIRTTLLAYRRPLHTAQARVSLQQQPRTNTNSTTYPANNPSTRTTTSTYTPWRSSVSTRNSQTLVGMLALPLPAPPLWLA